MFELDTHDLSGGPDSQESDGFLASFGQGYLTAKIRAETEKIHQWKIRSEGALNLKTTQVEHARKSVLNLMESLKALKNQRQELQVVLNQSKEIFAQVEDESRLKDSQIRVLQETFTQYQAEFELSVQKQHEYKTFVAQSKHDRDDLLAIWQEIKDDRLKDIEKIRDQMQAVDLEGDEIEQALHKLHAEYLKMERENDVQKNESSALKLKNQEIQKIMEQLQYQITLKDDTKDNLERDLDTFQSQQSKEVALNERQMNELENWLLELSTREADLRTNLGNVQETIITVQTNLNLTQDHIGKVKDQLKALIGTIQAFENQVLEEYGIKEEKVKVLNETITNCLEPELQEQCAQAKVYDTQGRHLTEKIRNLSQDLDGRVVEVRELERKRDNLLCSREELKLIKTDLKLASDEVVKLRSIEFEGKRLDEENHGLRSNIEILDGKRKAFASDLKSKLAERGLKDREVHANLLKAQEKLARIDSDLESCGNILDDQLEGLKEKIVETDDRRAKEIKDLEHLHEELLEDRRKEADELASFVEKLEKKIVETQNDLRQELKESNAKAEAKQNNARKKKTDILKPRDPSPEIRPQPNKAKEQQSRKRRALLPKDIGEESELDDDLFSSKDTAVKKKYGRSPATKEKKVGFIRRDREYRFFKTKNRST